MKIYQFTMGISPHKYVVERRLARAKKLLKEQKRSLFYRVNKLNHSDCVISEVLILKLKAIAFNVPIDGIIDSQE